MGSVKGEPHLVEGSHHKIARQGNLQNCEEFTAPPSFVAMCCVAIAVFIGVGLWLTFDLQSSFTEIMKDRETLALQTSGLMSQRFFNTLTAADYVLQDITTSTTGEEINLASNDHERQNQLSTLLREKLATLPNVYGLGFLDQHCIYVAAADENIIGIKSNSKLNVQPGQVLERKTYVEYVPATKSANKEPAIIVSRPILSAEGVFEGGALAAIMLSTTQDWIQSYQIGQFDTIAMMDDQGILLAHNPSMPNAIGTTLNFIVGQSKVALGDVNKTFSAVSPIDGRERIYGVSKIENIPLYIVIGYDKQQSLNEWQRRLWQTAVGFLALMIVAFLMLRNHRKVLLKQQELRRLSVTDPLTCIANRRQIMLLGENEITRALRYKTTVSVLMLDIDHFKSVNDSYGHQVGDKVIQYLAQSMVSNLRSFDIVGRLGGEEFALILPETSSDDALKIANRLRQIIEQSDAAESATGKPIHITVSIGVASMKEGDPSFSNLLGKADEALYNAKSKGRNRVEFAS